jgi:hypothetical protein
MADDVANPQIPQAVQTNLLPKEGLRTSLLEWKFTAQVTQVETDFYQVITGNQLSAVRCLYVDNADNAQSLTIFFLESRQRVVIPPKAQIYIPVLTANNCTTLAQTTGAVTVRVHAMNFTVPPFTLAPKSGGSAGGTIDLTDEGGAPFAASAINFTGAGVTMTPGAGGSATVAVPSPAAADEGTNLGAFTTINFKGAGVTAVAAGPGLVEVTIPGTANPLAILDEGVQKTAAATSINFTGGVVATAVGGVVTVDSPPPTIQCQDEGAPVVNATAVNFVGAGVQVTTPSPGVAQVTVAAGGIQSVDVQDEGASVVAAQSLNFVGSSVTASLASAGVAKIAINPATLVRMFNDWPLQLT